MRKWDGRVLVLVVVAACALAVAVPAPQAAQQVTLRFMTWYFGEEPAATALRTLLKEYQQRNPNVRIVEDTVTAAERVTKFSSQMEAGQGPDIYMDSNQNGLFLISKGYCADLEPFASQVDGFKNRFAKGILADFTGRDGHVYFVPFAIGPTALVYNERMWKAAGLDPDKPPKTWEELADDAAKLTGGGRYGIGLFGKGDGSSVSRFAYWWMTNGASVLNQQGTQATLNTPEFIEAIKFWTSLFREKKVSPPSTPQNSFGEINALFAGEVVGMVESGVWQFGVTETMNPALKGHLRAALMPVRKAPVAAGGSDNALCISSKSQLKKEAFDLLNFLTTEAAGIQEWKIHGKFPGNLAALNSPEIQNDPLVKAWKPILPYSRTAVWHERAPEIYDALGVMMQQVLTGRPVEESVRAANDKINGIVSRK